MKIVRATTKDVNSLFEVEQAVFVNDAFALSKPSFYYHCKKSIIFKAVEDKKVVGYILWLKRKSFYRLYSLAILPQFRGQNIATKLLEKSLDKLDKNIFTLEVKQSNKQAIALYEKLGFIVCKELKEYYENEDGFWMKLHR